MSSNRIEARPNFSKLRPRELSLGMVVPWSIYDKDLVLLLHEGMRINTERLLTRLIENGVYRSLTRAEADAEGTSQSKTLRTTPLAAVHELESRLEPLLRTLADRGAVGSEVKDLAHDIDTLCGDDADAMLAAVHLASRHSYAVQHPLHTAMLCALLTQRLGYDVSRRDSVLAAALTMNIGMLDLQNQLFEQREELTADQKQAILNHPEASVKALLSAGITDRLWLMAVHQHHERIDGSGYPKQLSGDGIIQEARILALADVYAALVTPRRHRKPVLAKEALRTIFINRGKKVDEELVNHFIREIGIFPPGAFVRLANGEVAVVARRAVTGSNQDSTMPIVYAVINGRGNMHQLPQYRDCQIEHFHIEEMCLPEIDRTAILQAIWGR